MAIPEYINQESDIQGEYMNHLKYMLDLTDEQKVVFQKEYDANSKDHTKALLFAFFLGGIGGHQFYMGKTGMGILYAAFCWTGIPALASFVEMFQMKDTINRYNVIKV